MFISFFMGFMVGFVLHVMSERSYQRILVGKAYAPKYGQSNVEYILGKPYVILHESDYIKDCKVWYKE